jgi:hypothetical protein
MPSIDSFLERRTDPFYKEASHRAAAHRVMREPSRKRLKSDLSVARLRRASKFDVVTLVGALLQLHVRTYVIGAIP